MKDVKQMKRYQPLFVLILIAALGGLALEYGMEEGFYGWAQFFMGLVFCLFSMLKLFNLAGFVEGFKKYDLVAQNVPGYAYIYPFIELFLGLAYLAFFYPILIYSITIVVTVVSAIGVIIALRKGLNVKCACMGTILDVPLSTVTLTEDILLGLMACWMLFSL